MDVSRDDVRRAAAGMQPDHVSALRETRELVARLFTGERATAAAKADAATDGLHRRGFLRIGGIGIASAAIFAACGTDDDDSGATAKDAVEDAADEEGEASENDLTILRTASSLELVAVEVYQQAIDSGLLTTTALKDAATLFQRHHTDHAELFQGATKELGGEAFEKPNPVVLRSLEPRLAGLTDERSAVQLAYDLETAAAATYVSAAGSFDAGKLNRTAMSVGGIEARHAAVLAATLGVPQVPRVFFATDGAVAPGTGL
ncbi:MAG TPA: ferritin-like domain-containing protein [Acidimicrobiales bacterium]